MNGEFSNLKLAGIATAVPTSVKRNEDLIPIVGEKIVKKQIMATGIEEHRQLGSSQTAVDLCISAANSLLKKLLWDRKEIKVVIYVSSYTLFDVPSTAFYIQDKLDIGTDCIAFDINMACSGFVVGIETLGSVLQHCEIGSKALLLLGSGPSKTSSNMDKSGLPLFGDGGGVAAFELKEGYKTIFSQYSDGKKLNNLYKINKNDSLHMNGMGVFNFTISNVADSINYFFDYYNIERDNVDYFFLHQAQKFIIDKLIDFCNLDEDKCPVSYKYYGNTGAVSIPLNISSCSQKIDFSKRNTIFMSGFGAGLSWGNVLMEIEDVIVLPVESTDFEIDRSEYIN